jgi:hypothetical protein
LQDLFQETISEANDAATIKNIIINLDIGDEIILTRIIHSEMHFDMERTKLSEPQF